ALLVPAARARHAGSATGQTLSRERWRLIYGNRYLAAARLLGRSFWPRMPRMAARDAIDVAKAAARGEGELAMGALAGWGRAARRGTGGRVAISVAAPPLAVAVGVCAADVAAAGSLGTTA